MSLHEDLLDLAEYLTRHESGKPKQATLRRAISTAYYSVFHLLVREASQFLVANVHLRVLLARAFDHGEMKRVSRTFAAGNLPDSLKAFEPVPGDLKAVADAFVQLQEARHEADYHIGRGPFSRNETASFVEQARLAFDAWKKVRGAVVSQAYLASILFAKKWDR